VRAGVKRTAREYRMVDGKPACNVCGSTEHLMAACPKNKGKAIAMKKKARKFGEGSANKKAGPEGKA
jgi:hypothetical protein